MEFWEGAILVVGGVWLVAHMANRQKQNNVSVIGTASTGRTGTSNESNLTNITNTAGQITVYGESLEAPQRPVSGAIVAAPYRVSPVAQPAPLYKSISAIAPKSGAIIARAPVGFKSVAPPSNVKTVIPRPISVML